MYRQTQSTTAVDEQTHKQLDTTDCPECSGRLQTDSGEISCPECGHILASHRLDRRGPSTFPDDDRQRERAGAPLTEARHDRGLTTEIGRTRDGKGNTLASGKRRRLGRMRREHQRAQYQSKAERNLAHGCGEIARLVGRLNLSRDVREQASALFRTAQNDDLLRGRSVESIAAACVYAVCRCTDRTRTLDEVSAKSQVSTERVTNAYSVLNCELELPTPPQRPRAFVATQASAVDLPSAVERAGRELAERATDAEVSVGAHPGGFAAACLAVIARDRGVEVTQQALAEAAGVSTATVREHRDAIREAVAIPR